jgi:hypothetical protein
VRERGELVRKGDLIEEAGRAQEWLRSSPDRMREVYFVDRGILTKKRITEQHYEDVWRREHNQKATARPTKEHHCATCNQTFIQELTARAARPLPMARVVLPPRRWWQRLLTAARAWIPPLRGGKTAKTAKTGSDRWSCSPEGWV